MTHQDRERHVLGFLLWTFSLVLIIPRATDQAKNWTLGGTFSFQTIPNTLKSLLECLLSTKKIKTGKRPCQGHLTSRFANHLYYHQRRKNPSKLQGCILLNLYIIQEFQVHPKEERSLTILDFIDTFLERNNLYKWGNCSQRAHYPHIIPKLNFLTISHCNYDKFIYIESIMNHLCTHLVLVNIKLILSSLVLSRCLRNVYKYH